MWKEPDPVEHSDYYYDYKRNDPNAKNPFTDPKDRERAENLDLDRIERMEEFEWTPGSPWPPRDPEEDGLDYEVDLMTDQYAHHYTTYDDGMSLQVTEKKIGKNR